MGDERRRSTVTITGDGSHRAALIDEGVLRENRRRARTAERIRGWRLKPA